MAIRLNHRSISHQLKLNNGGINHRTTAGVCSIIHRRQDATTARGRRQPFRREMLRLNGSSLPLSRMLHACDDSTLHRTHCQVPFTLPYSYWIPSVQEEMLVDLNPRFVSVNSPSSRIMILNHPRVLVNHVHSVFSLASNKVKNVGNLNKSDCQIRGFCGVSNSDGESDEFVRARSLADEKEVERVCNVIEELFALDRNMEAVLDDCGISLSHDLVLDVLERFRHARRPAFRFFSWAGQQPGFSHDSRTYNMMMSILGKTKQFETMISLLDEIGEKGLLTLETFQICIKSFAAAQQRRKAVGIFELMKKHNFKVGVSSINCLLDNLGRAKLGKEAQILFEKLKGRFTPNIQTYTVLLNGWCNVGNLLEAGKVWNEMIDKGLNPDIVAYNTMLEGLLKVHKRSDAVKLFEVMKAKGPSPNERSYTIMIRDLCKQKRMKDAVEYYEDMLSYGCKPDAAVYTCLITGFGNQKQMDKVYGLLKEMKENGCPPDGRMYNALIKLMTNRQMPDDAVRIYKKMIQNGIDPTIHTYNMMLKSFFRNENYDMGLAVWEEMSRKGVCPDDNSYTVFIGGLVRQGRSMEACKYLEEMIEKGMKPPQLDYSKFAADFSRAGKPNILEELAQKMRLEGKLEVSDIFAGYAETMKKTDMGEKQQWSIEQQKCLIETCIEEVNKLGRKGLSMHKESWNNLGKVLKERFGLDLTQKQMKNAYDNLKAKYVGWLYLKNKTGNIYNPQTNTFSLTNEEWEEFKKGHPKAGSLKTIPLPFPELCAQLFDGNTATGGSKWTSTQTTSVVGSSSCHRAVPLMLTDTIIHDTDDDAGSYDVGSEHINEDAAEPTAEPTTDPTPEPTPEPTPNSNKRAKTSKSSSITNDDLARDMQKALQYIIKGKEGPTVLECSEKLKLVGLDPIDPLFLAAFHIFGVSSDMREAWMTLPPIPEVLRGWISMTATSFRLIK